MSVVVKVLKKQGVAKNKPDSVFNVKELLIGGLIELEHTSDKKAAREIAKDHLMEDANYYKDPLFKEERDKVLKKLKMKKSGNDLTLGAVKTFLLNNPNPDDDTVHDWAEKNGYNIHKVEELVYELATDYVVSMKKAQDDLFAKVQTVFPNVDLNELGVHLKKDQKSVFIFNKAQELNSSQKEAMRHPDKLGAGAKKRKKLQGKDKFDVVMKEFARGTLHDSAGKIVTDQKQALAIAYSESGLKKSGSYNPKTNQIVHMVSPSMFLKSLLKH